jgi:hypothetical protein
VSFLSPISVFFSSIFGVSSDLGIRVNLSYFQDLVKCRLFDWLDVYTKRIKMEGASLKLKLGSATRRGESGR